MVAVVVVIMGPEATTVTPLLLGVILVAGTDATATGGITTASKVMVDILEMRVVVAMMHTNRVAEEEAAEGVWGDRVSNPLLERVEESGGEIISFLKAIGRVPIHRKCSNLSSRWLLRLLVAPLMLLAAAIVDPMRSSQVHKYEFCPPHGVQ